MLGKLIKHDFRGFSRTLFPLQVGVLAGGLLATVLARLTLINIGAGHQSALAVFGVLSALLSGVLVVAVMASALVTLIVICIRLQQSFFGDEGYLTFSLPVSSGRLLWSKIITGAIWIVINALIIFATLSIFSVFGTAEEGLMNRDALTMLRLLFGGFGELIHTVFTTKEVPGAVFMALLAVLDVVAYLLVQLLSLYFAVIVGGMIAKKHKLMATVAMYLAVHFVLGIVFALCGVSGIGFVSGSTLFGPLGLAWTALTGALIVLVLLSLGLFAWSRHLIKNRLNLQ